MIQFLIAKLRLIHSLSIQMQPWSLHISMTTRLESMEERTIGWHNELTAHHHSCECRIHRVQSYK